VPTKPSSITAGRPQPVPIAFVYRDGANDSAWTISHERARKVIAAEFGERISTIAVEHVATREVADKAFAELAARGYKVIFATDAVHADASLKMAAADYDVKVEQALGTQSLINVRTYEIRHIEQAYLAGIVAAGNSATRTLGFIGTDESAANVALVNAFALGAQSVNSQITTHVAWLSAAPTLAAETSVAAALIRADADVLLSTTDAAAATAQLVEKQGKRFIGWHADRGVAASRAQVATLALDWAPFYRAAVKESFDYLCTKSDTSRGFRDGAIKVLGLSKTTSSRAVARLDEVEAVLMRGEFDALGGNTRSKRRAEMAADRDASVNSRRPKANAYVTGVTLMDVSKTKPRSPRRV
jgi:basic membrane protein A and related proteins